MVSRINDRVEDSVDSMIAVGRALGDRYAELRAQARWRWSALTEGSKPWLRVGYGASGQAAGADAVFEALKEYGPEGTAQLNHSLVGAHGLLYLEPIVDVWMPRVGRTFYAGVTPEMVPDIVAHHLGDGTMPESAFAFSPYAQAVASQLPLWDDLPANRHQTKVLTSNFGNIDPHDIFHYIVNDGYAALNKAVTSMSPEEVLEEVKTSGLRGRGGAAFPTGLKWSFLAPSKDPVKYVLCNCEEGDPGAFNDKGILESDPHRLIEGLIINGYATRRKDKFILTFFKYF